MVFSASSYATIPKEPKLTFLDTLYLYTIDKIADKNGFDHWNDIYNELYSRLNATVSPTDSATKVTLDLLQSQPFLNLELNHSDYIAVLYEMLYDRAPDQNELDSWVQKLESGKLREMVAYDFIRSQEFKNLTRGYGTVAFSEADNALFQLKSFIQRFYQLVLGREPDRDGFNYWVSHLTDGSESGGKIAIGFFQSSEFINRQTSDSDFLDIVYHSFFNREAGSAGKKNWIDELSLGTSRLEVINGFVGSQEFFDLAKNFGIAISNDAKSNPFQIKGFVTRFYQLVLNREPDSTGFNYWSSQLIDGTETGGNIARGFFESSEFTNRQTADSEFLDIAYRSFFNREADSAGKHYWMRELSLGTSRLNVINGFIASQEFIDFAHQFGINAN